MMSAERVSSAHNERSDRHCRVCGWFLEESPWESDASFPTCPCCGVEFGYQDFTTMGATRYRNIWIEGGAQWKQPHKRPLDWDLEAQLENVPLDFVGQPNRSLTTV